jgi:environmental stress-induced protein Ves
MMSEDRLDLPPSHAVSIIRAAQCTPVPWRNGGGFTLEIATWPEGASLDTFLWRVSVATIDTPGPFSHFRGVDRSLTLIDGDTMVLQETLSAHVDAAPPLPTHEGTSAPADDGTAAERRVFETRDHALTLWDSLRFPGEADLISRLPSGPTRDFNLMWRRGSCKAEVDVIQGTDHRAVLPGSTLFYCARGGYHVDDVLLAPGDTYVMQAAQVQSLTLAPSGNDAALVCAHIAVSMLGDDTPSERGLE